MNNLLLIIKVLFFIFLNSFNLETCAYNQHASPHQHCFNYNFKTLFKIACNAYDKEKVKIINAKDSLSNLLNSEELSLIYAPNACR